MEFYELKEIAQNLVNSRRISKTAKVGAVACALETKDGNIYTGICAVISCSLGFCAEQAAIAHMITAGEQDISKMVVVYRDGCIIAPCGRCCELMFHISHGNYEITQILVPDGKTVLLKELLPKEWVLQISEHNDIGKE